MSVTTHSNGGRQVKENRSMTSTHSYPKPAFVTDRNAYAAGLRSGTTFGQITSGLTGGATRLFGKQF